jgi:hypothetical protein
MLKTLQYCCVCHPLQAHCHRHSTTILDQKRRKELHGFLGVVNLSRRLVPAAARIPKPLTDLLKGSPKSVAAIPWTDGMQAAFVAAKAAITG